MNKLTSNNKDHDFGWPAWHTKDPALADIKSRPIADERQATRECKTDYRGDWTGRSKTQERHPGRFSVRPSLPADALL